MNFLDTNSFEQMAKEYNKKYATNNTTILANSNSVLQTETKQVFIKIINLLESIKNTFKYNGKFYNLFKQCDQFKNSLNTFYENTFNQKINIEKSSKHINHKQCALLMLNSYIQIFNLNMSTLQQITKLKNCLLLDYSSLEELLKNNEEQPFTINTIKLNPEIKKNLDYLTSTFTELQTIFKEYSEILNTFYTLVN